MQSSNNSITALIVAIALVLSITACNTQSRTTYKLEPPIDLRNQKIIEGNQNEVASAFKNRVKAKTQNEIIPLKTCFPKYPDDLLDAGIEGSSMIDFLVNEKGRVTDIKITYSSYPEFDAVSVKCIKQWRFAPIMKDGKPTKAWLRQIFMFRVK